MLIAPFSSWPTQDGITPLALTYLALAAAIVGWNIATTTRIVHAPSSARAVVLSTGIGVLLLIPAIAVAIATSSVTYGRAIQNVAWLWPAVTLLFVVQAGLALYHRLVNPVFGSAILLYNLIIALVAVGRYLSGLGVEPPTFVVAFSAAQAEMLSYVGGSSTLWDPQWLLIPLLAPAAPSRSRLKRGIRITLSLTVMAVSLIQLAVLPNGFEAVNSYHRFATASLSERPSGGLAFGVRIFSVLREKPTTTQIERDFSVLDSLNADAIAIAVTAEAAQTRTLDSLAHALDLIRSDATVLVITLGYSHDAKAALAASPDKFVEAQLSALNRITRTLRPSIIIPAHEPYGEGARILGVLPVSFWQDYLTRAARLRNGINPNVRIGLATATDGPADSVLYAWAARRASPVDVMGFSLLPTLRGGRELDVRVRTGQRWMRNLPLMKPHWIWAAGGYPATHGERSQQLSLRTALAWATLHPFIHGIIVDCAGDYDKQCGLITPAKRPRAAFMEYLNAIARVRETIVDRPLEIHPAEIQAPPPDSSR